MSAVPSPRRGSFFETLRLFANGGGSVVVLALIMVGSFGLMAFMQPHGKRSVAGSVFMVTSMLPVVTWFVERQLANRLAFLSLLPQPVEAKWLVLAPMCAVALVSGAVAAMFGRAPAIAGLAVLGCGWWMVGSARWLHPIDLWAWLAWPVVVLVPAAAYGAYRFGGWGPAAAVAMAFGVGALVFQPRAYVGRPLPHTDEQQHADAPAAPPAPRSHEAVSLAAAERQSTLASAMRFFRVATESSPVFLVLLCVMMVIVGLFPIAGRASQTYWPLIIFLVPRQLGKTYAPAVREFLAAVPFGGRPRFVGGVVLPLALFLIAPATAACLVNRELFDHGGALGWIISGKPPSEDSIRYLRDVLGATFLPDKWPAGGLPLDLWARLRPLLYLDLLRTTLLMLTPIFALAPVQRGSSNGQPRRLSNFVLMVLAVLALFCMLRLETDWPRIVPLPTLWFAALLAAIAIASFARQARAVSAPARREDGRS